MLLRGGTEEQFLHPPSRPHSREALPAHDTAVRRVGCCAKHEICFAGWSCHRLAAVLTAPPYWGHELRLAVPNAAALVSVGVRATLVCQPQAAFALPRVRHRRCAVTLTSSATHGTRAPRPCERIRLPATAALCAIALESAGPRQAETPPAFAGRTAECSERVRPDLTPCSNDKLAQISPGEMAQQAKGRRSSRAGRHKGRHR